MSFWATCVNHRPSWLVWLAHSSEITILNDYLLTCLHTCLNVCRWSTPDWHLLTSHSPSFETHFVAIWPPVSWHNEQNPDTCLCAYACVSLLCRENRTNVVQIPDLCLQPMEIKRSRLQRGISQGVGWGLRLRRCVYTCKELVATPAYLRHSVNHLQYYKKKKTKTGAELD